MRLSSSRPFAGRWTCCRMLTEPASDGRMTDCVAYAEPPATVPSAVSIGGKGTSVSGRCCSPIASGEVAGGTVAQGVEGRDDSP